MPMLMGHIQMDQLQRASSDTESRERAGSSDPSSTRPNPFDDDDGSSARKRRRTSINGASSSRSIDTPPGSCSPLVVTEDCPGSVDNDHLADVTMTMDATSSEPQTPERRHEQPPPTSESKPTKITLNLKSKKQIPQSDSSSSLSQNEVDEDLVGPQENGIRLSVEDEFDDLPGPDFADSVSSVLEDNDNLPIEIIDDDDDDDDDDEDQDAGVIVLNGSDSNPMISFPYQPSEPLVDSLPKLCHLLHNNIQALCALRTWIEGFVAWSGRVESTEMHELYKDYRDFWQSMPTLVYNNTSPKLNTMARSHQTHQLFFEFHVVFAQLTATFVEMDCAEMANGVSEQGWQEPASTSFLNSLHWLMIDYAKVIAPTVHIMDADAPWPELVNRLLDSFRSFRKTTASPPLATSVYNLGHSLAKLVPSHPRLIESLAGIVQMAAALLRSEYARLRTPAYMQSPDQAKSALALARGYGFFKAASDALHLCIDKNVNQITPLTAEFLIAGLTNVLRLSLRPGCEHTQNLVKAHQRKHPVIQHEDITKIVVNEWRLDVFTKLIMSSQMQLRIFAAPCMCADLVDIWRENQDIPQPVLQHFSDELRRSGVIDYILGPTCHPEVTTQSFNIIGFLFASQTITDEQMDLMWRTATTCQISGVSESLLAMIGNIANLFSMHDLLSVCRKLQTVPIENFTPTMKDFCDKIVCQLYQKHNNIQDLLPYSLMFRLLRESSVPGPQSYQAIQKWASDIIPQLLRRGPSSEDRQLLQQECLKDITEQTRYTLGSIHALVLLCRPVSRDRDLQQLISQHNLPQLLVHELEHAINSREEMGLQHAISGPENAPRLQLLGSVVFGADRNVLTEELGRKLWDLLVGQTAATQEDRDCAWLRLNAAMESEAEHPFLEICFKDYFPTLKPELFRPGSLDFILHKIVPLLKKADTFALEDTESSDHLAVEQLWRFALIAPSGTVEQRAIGALVRDVYLENPAMRQMPLHRARKIHLALVSRCMQQLSSAAKQCTSCSRRSEDKGDDAMDVTVDEQQTSEQEQLFTRSLTIVTEFHKLHRQTPPFSSPDLRSLVLSESKGVAGESAELKVQSFDGDTQTDVKPLAIGRLNTAGSLLASIRSVTGFDNYRLYYKGQAFTPSEQDICRSLEDLQIHNGLILVKRETDVDERPVHVRPGASPVEIEIMRYFEELWEFLALKETLADKIYDFLVTLPVDEQILNLLKAETTTYRDIFPVGQPLKSLYALYAIREYLNPLAALASPSEESRGYDAALQRILGLVVSAISDREVIDSGSGAILKAKLASRLVRQFARILTDPTRAPFTTTCLDITLVERLGALLSSALEAEPTPPITDLVIETFKAILDTCTLIPELWKLLHSQMNLRDTVKKLLIDDDRDIVRKSIASCIGDKIDENPRDPFAVPASTLRGFFWPLLMELVLHALANPTHSFECFNLTVAVLRSAKRSQPPGIDLQMAVQHITDILLLKYSSNEVPALTLALPRPADEMTSNQSIIQPGAIDLGAFGLVTLLNRLLCDDGDQDIVGLLPPGHGCHLFARYLFPEGRHWSNADALWPHGLIFHETTRIQLNNVVLQLAGRDVGQLEQLFMSLHAMLPCTTNDRLAYDSVYAYDTAFNFERAREIRAACGYAGLKNLSNTCYLNSLCTQLFMNVDFRQFMLSFEVDERDGSRMLLHETQNMFGRLQSSQHRFVDPESFVASIKTYDDDLINVYNQMDVEEFFNLVNDRWESQLRSQEAVRRFRTFYGGQLVTQTKSKECDHISEVMEPFSAIQCDIKGKKNLLDSLEAYVDGEHMEGDNKYKCSSCDRHVDAVRRSCLKEIPNSLIFHLKRFEFNLRAQSRNKINDYFAFPNRIDMRPYTVEHLSNSPGGSEEDWFELVGVLVHAGTAESGHYYSFIRERPSSRPDGSWFEFNDDVVSPWKSSNLEACCFGGPESTWDAGGVRYDKNYCAYMLFYERASTLERKQQELQKQAVGSPIQVPVPHRLDDSIKFENVRLLRRHCFFDPDHIRFVAAAIERMIDLNQGGCSEYHTTEKLAIETALAHLDQVVSRTKDAREAQRLADLVTKMVRDCPKCAFNVYDYFSSRHEAFRNLIQRCPEVGARRCTVDILMASLACLKDNFPDDYYSPTLVSPAGEDLPDDIVHGVCAMFDFLMANFHVVSMHRSWPEVFDLMARFVEGGKDELLVFLNYDFLSKVLMILVVPFVQENERDAQFTRFANFLARRPNRQPNYASVIALLRNILVQVTMKDPVSGPVQREARYMHNPDDPLRLTTAEIRLLETPLDVSGNALIDKIICTDQNVEATDAIITHILEHRWGLDIGVLQTLIINLTPQHVYVVYAPYLRVAEKYCQLSHHPDRINQLIEHIAENSKAVAVSEAKALWSFFRIAMDGRRYHSGESQTAIFVQNLKYMPAWAPALLQHYDASLSSEVETMLNEKVFSSEINTASDEEHAGEAIGVPVSECAKRIGIQCCEYARDVYIRRNQAVQSSTVAVIHRVLSQVGKYFGEEEADGQAYLQNCRVVLDNLRRLSVEDLEDDGSDWGDSVASSDQVESVGDDEIKDFEF